MATVRNPHLHDLCKTGGEVFTYENSIYGERVVGDTKFVLYLVSCWQTGPNIGSSMEKAVPLSEFRAHASKLIEGISAARGFVYLTRNGYSVAVVADVEEFERIYGYAIDHGYKAGRYEQSE